MGVHARPFETTDEMDEALIKNWNAVVDPEDEVFHLGDVGLNKPERLKEILGELNGKIYLIEGNHEHTAKKAKCIDRFEWVKPYHKLDEMIDGKDIRICLFHFPIACWDKSHHGAFCLHGHSHGSYFIPKGKILDVGIDGPISNLAPVSLTQVIEYMKTREHEVLDHHDPLTKRA